MPPFIVFDAQDFLEEVTKVKKFWMHTKLNKLRIETNRNESTISLYSIHKESGLETAVTIPAYISADCIMTIGTVNPYVTGSSPVVRAKNFPIFRDFYYYFPNHTGCKTYQKMTEYL